MKTPRQQLLIEAAHKLNRQDLKNERKPLCSKNKALAHLMIEEVFNHWQENKTHIKAVRYYVQASDASLERLINDVIKYRIRGY